MGDELLADCGRMLMVGFRGARPGDLVLEASLESCRRARVGAVVLFDRDLASGGEARSRNIESPEQLVALTARIREVLGPDVWVAIDQEGGRGARLNETNGHQRGEAPRTVGRMSGPDRGSEWDQQASQLARAGIDWNLAPGVDLDVAGSGSVIETGERSFGRDPRLVGQVAADYIARFAQAGVASCVKHFPGHGSASVDSHDDLPDVTACHLDDEIEAFRGALNDPRVKNRAALMTAHLLHRGVDPHEPASLSREWHRVIREDLGFDGVVLTDALDMGAITRRYPVHDAMERAINAGSDMLLLANNMPDRSAEIDPLDAAEHIAHAVRAGRIDGGRARLRDSVRRIESFRTSN